VIHNIYVRRVERINGELYNQEIATFETIKDPLKATKQRAAN
jgi:branched-chain amino acid transport system substrate-binding protein